MLQHLWDLSPLESLRPHIWGWRRGCPIRTPYPPAQRLNLRTLFPFRLLRLLGCTPEVERVLFLGGGHELVQLVQLVRIQLGEVFCRWDRECWTEASSHSPTPVTPLAVTRPEFLCLLPRVADLLAHIVQDLCLPHLVAGGIVL